MYVQSKIKKKGEINKLDFSPGGNQNWGRGRTNSYGNKMLIDMDSLLAGN